MAVASILVRHPCFCDEAHDQVGRIHLPVAPRCNIKCNFCEHKLCTQVQHPGWAARVLSVSEAINLVGSIVNKGHGDGLVVGVAGPGDALVNAQTFEALAAIHTQYPQTVNCLCTNGLLLEDSLEQIAAAGVKALTVTVNACDSQIGERIYAWAVYRGITYRGEKAAALLIAKQFRGLESAIAAGFAVKVNTVLIPGVNDRHIRELASRLRSVGVQLMNIVPLIPSGQMKGLAPPTREELERARADCEELLPQFHRCEQCRADVIFLPKSNGVE